MKFVGAVQSLVILLLIISVEAHIPRPRDFTLSQVEDTSDSIFIAVRGFVYDISRARGLYGEETACSCLASRDITQEIESADLSSCTLNCMKMNSSDTGIKLTYKGTGNSEAEYVFITVEKWIAALKKNHPKVGHLINPISDPLRTFTPEQLSKFKGANFDQDQESLTGVNSGKVDPSILIAVDTMVIDVSYGGVGFYGPGQHYSILAGVDATRVLGKMNMSEVIDRCTYPVVPLVLCEDGSGPAADADSVSAVDDEGGVSQTDAQVKTCTPIVKKRHSNPLRDYSDFTSQQLKDLNRVVQSIGLALKETGKRGDRVGLTVAENEGFREAISRHRPVMNLFEKRPVMSLNCFVAPNASVVGKVMICNYSSVMYGAVIRGDKNRVVVGQYTSIQDRAVVQCSTSANLETGFPAVMEIGSYCTIGHGSVLTSCIIEDDVVVGPGAIIQEGSVVKCRSVVMAGSVVLPHTVIENYQMWAGNPAVHVRDLDDDEIKNIRINAEETSRVAAQHMDEFLDYGTVYQEGEKKGVVQPQV